MALDKRFHLETALRGVHFLEIILWLRSMIQRTGEWVRPVVSLRGRCSMRIIDKQRRRRSENIERASTKVFRVRCSVSSKYRFPDIFSHGGVMPAEYSGNGLASPCFVGDRFPLTKKRSSRARPFDNSFETNRERRSQERHQEKEIPRQARVEGLTLPKSSEELHTGTGYPTTVGGKNS